MIVLDTNVLSESLRPRPARQVSGWMNRHRALGLFTTAVSLGELLYGVNLLPTGKRKVELRAQVEDLLAAGFRDRILDFDTGAARSYAGLAAQRQLAGSRMPTADAQIAAICLAHGAQLRPATPLTSTAPASSWSTRGTRSSHTQRDVARRYCRLVSGMKITRMITVQIRV